MSDNVIQTSFNSGEWSPSLYAQVNLKQYHSGAALLRNFFVDTRGGATTRPGTRYIATCRSNDTVRPIPFQASFTVSYLLEFGQGYVRFYNNGAPVLEANKNITGATQANPGVITSNAHGYANGDWIFISNVVGMTQLNGNTYVVAGVTTNTFTLVPLFGSAVNTLAFTPYTSGGTAQRIYTITSPYQASEVFGIRYTQNVNQLYLCHPNYPPYVLTLVSATSWTLVPMVIGSTLSAPTGQSVSSTLAAGSVNYGYVITAVDINGQESAPSGLASLGSATDLRSVAGTNSVLWTAVPGAVSYNVYKAEPRYGAGVPAGAAFGFVGNCTGTVFVDSNINPDFAQGQPVVQNPFSGSGVQSVAVTAPGNYTGNFTVPSVSFSGGGGTGAAAIATIQCLTVTLFASGSSYAVGDLINIAYGIRVQVTSISGGGGFGPIATIALIITASKNS